jgi:hypothetical protein
LAAAPNPKEAHAATEAAAPAALFRPNAGLLARAMVAASVRATTAS